MAMAALPELLIGTIIHRFPPDDPACLFRALAVSQAWRDFITDEHLIGVYRRFHRAPPLLGFVQNSDLPVEDPRFIPTTTRFFPTTTRSPPIGMPQLHRTTKRLALDCRHGRVLLHTLDPPFLFVWNPTTGQLLPNHAADQPEEPVLQYYPLHAMSYYTGAVLCAVHGCDHLYCAGGAFRVVFVATANIGADVDIEEVFTWAIAYSSETDSWTERRTVHPGPLMNNPAESVMGPSLLAGDSVYFNLDLENSRSILRYHLVGNALSVMDPPPLPPLLRRDTFLVTGEDGGLGVAAWENEKYNLRLSSWRDGVWTPWRTIEIVPFSIGNPTTVLKVIGFAEMSSRVMFVSTVGVISTLDLKSGNVRAVARKLNLNPTTIFPFESFYTPGMGPAGEDEDEGVGPGEGEDDGEGERRRWGEFLTL